MNNCNIRNLSVLAYANGFTLWHYKAPNTLATVCSPDFWNECDKMTATGDMMMVTGTDGAGLFYVGPGSVLVKMA